MNTSKRLAEFCARLVETENPRTGPFNLDEFLTTAADPGSTDLFFSICDVKYLDELLLQTFRRADGF